jgi:AcrR family transcriptional regulator
VFSFRVHRYNATVGVSIPGENGPTVKATPPRPGRPREPEVDQRLRAAVLALVRTGGPQAVTVEAVAAESGVAKTTIYRRHANRSELLRTVLESAIGTPDRLGEGSVRDKIRYALGQAWRQMTEVLGPGGLSAIVLNADPQFTDLFRAALRPYEDVLVAEIRADVDAGLLRQDVDADGVVSLFLGAYLGELVRRGRVDEEWLERCLDMIWALLVPASGT